MKKILLIFILMVLFINFGSSFEFDNIKNTIGVGKGESIVLGQEEVNYNPLWEKYGIIKIDNMFGLGSTLFKGAITKHTEKCGSDCESDIIIELGIEEALIQDIKFIGNIDNYKLYVQEGTKDLEIDDYTRICIKDVCNNVKIGSHIEQQPNWVAYELGEIRPAGTYNLKIEADKSYKEEVDWQIKTNGIWLNEWAIWYGIAPTAYFKFENNLLDEMGLWNLTNAGASASFSTTIKKFGSYGRTYGSVSAGHLDKNTDLPMAINSDTFTMGYWINTSNDAAGDTCLITSIGNVLSTVGTESFFNGLNHTGEYAKFNQGGSAAPVTTAVTPIADGQWHRVVWVREGVGANQMRLYVDGVNTINGTFSQSLVASASGLYIGGDDVNPCGLIGTLDEVFIFNSTAWTVSDVANDYNGGAGNQISISELTLTLNSPADSYSSSSSVTFNCSATSGANLVNMSLYHNASGTFEINETLSASGTSDNKNFTKSFAPDGIYKWTCSACDSNGDCRFGSQNRTFIIDSTGPIITLNSPTSTISYGESGGTLNLNFTVTDTNLQACWYGYNGTNTTVGCSSGVNNQTTFNIANGVNSLIMYANDSVANLNSETVNWNYTIFQNSVSYNASSYDTAVESFSTNATGMTSANLIYNGTSYLATVSGDTATKSLSLSSTGNKSFYWSYNGGIVNGTTYYQNVLPITYSLCNSSLNVPYLNITFKDEISLAIINASISTSTSSYSLGSVNNSYSYSNTTENPSYAFCFSPADKTISVSNDYSAYSTGYPLRIFSYNNSALTNTTINQVFYLLASADGVYHTFTVTDSVGAGISGATVQASTESGGVVNVGTTDSSGIVEMWLNPTLTHTIYTTATGYPSDTRTVNPTSGGSTTIILGSTGTTVPSDVGDNILEGISYQIKPTSDLYNDTTYNFQFILTNDIYTLDSWGFTLYNTTNDEIGSATGTGNSGTAQTSIDVGSNTGIRMKAYWEVDGVYEYRTKQWVVISTANTQYSIWFLKNRLVTYLDSGLFGLTRGSFSLNLIAFIIILLTLGIFSYTLGINDPRLITVMLFVLVLLFEQGLGIISVERFKVIWFVGIIMVVTFIREGFR